MESNKSTPKHHKLFYGSSYDRGLDVLLFLWPDIIKKFPDAELHIAYGWALFDQFAKTNPERKEWKKEVERLMGQKGVFHYGRVGKKELSAIRIQCGIWAYPTYFHEINCITALETQKDGLVPATMTLGALNEAVQSGFKIEGDIKNANVRDRYLEELISLMDDRKRWEIESRKARKWAKGFYWSNIAGKWSGVFREQIKEPLVSVITITIRTGFWNIMADNLSKQTYRNFEWVIVDDYKVDRSDIAKKYADKYKIKIKYIRGDKALGSYKRRYGLVRANNKGWRNASGELTVWLQDFILIPDDGIERLVDLYRHNPNSLLAPTDIYYHCIKPDLGNKEDWFNGEKRIIKDFSWKNIRNNFEGIRITENPYDFEMNWGAIPRRILEELNGWWEFFDEGLGFDNAEISKRAMLAGYDIMIDDTNVAKCIDLWPILGGKAENILNRERFLNVPIWLWFEKHTENGDLPLIRDEEIDNKLNLQFSPPGSISNADANKWIRENATQIVEEWEKQNTL